MTKAEKKIIVEWCRTLQTAEYNLRALCHAPSPEQFDCRRTRKFKLWANTAVYWSLAGDVRSIHSYLSHIKENLKQCRHLSMKIRHMWARHASWNQIIRRYFK